jgi:hypothetical protein
MGLHEQAHAVLVKPSTPVTVAQLHKIHGTVVFIRPIVVLNAAYTYIQKHYAAGAKQGHHAPVRKSNVTITVEGISIGQHALETAPLLDHTVLFGSKAGSNRKGVLSETGGSARCV